MYKFSHLFFIVAGSHKNLNSKLSGGAQDADKTLPIRLYSDGFHISPHLPNFPVRCEKITTGAQY